MSACIVESADYRDESTLLAYLYCWHLAIFSHRVNSEQLYGYGQQGYGQQGYDQQGYELVTRLISSKLVTPKAAFSKPDWRKLL